MAQTVEIADPAVLRAKEAVTPERHPGLSVERAEWKLEGFVAELGKMTPDERIRSSRYTMTRREYFVYAARFPDEVPTVNGELERIALTLE